VALGQVFVRFLRLSPVPWPSIIVYLCLLAVALQRQSLSPSTWTTNLERSKFVPSSQAESGRVNVLNALLPTQLRTRQLSCDEACLCPTARAYLATDVVWKTACCQTVLLRSAVLNWRTANTCKPKEWRIVAFQNIRHSVETCAFPTNGSRKYTFQSSGSQPLSFPAPLMQLSLRIQTYWLPLRSGIAQSDPCTADNFWSTVRHHSWFIHQSSLAAAVAPSSKAGSWREMSLTFADVIAILRRGILTRRNILGHGAGGFISPPKEGVLRIFIALGRVWTREPWV
jgi:hypothetical protein